MINVMTPINHDRYHKITDDIMFLGPNMILRMNVSLYSNSENYGKTSYHKEFEYYDKVSNSNMISMKRSYDYYLSIENFKAGDGFNKEFIRIGINEIMLMRQSLGNAVQWFTNPEHQGLYVQSKNKLILTKKVQPIEINPLPMNKYIVLEPTIVTFNENEDTGVRIYLSSSENYADMALNRFMGFVQFIHDINIYMAAQGMINYLGRPDFGTNMYSFTDVRNAEPNGELVTGKSGRLIPSKVNNTGFNKFEN